LTQYTDMQLDALRELANIGSGTASTALSSMLGRSVDITVPSAKVLPMADAVGTIGDPEAEATGIALGVVGDMPASVLLLFTPKDAELMSNLLGVEAGTEIGESALMEIGNIVGASYLNALGTIASAAPLLGLLGTVIGMIEIFGSQAPAGGATGGNPAQLAHGISIALYNTAFGLIVAIPALIFWRYFRARVDEYLLTLELAAERFARHLNNLRRA